MSPRPSPDAQWIGLRPWAVSGLEIGAGADEQLDACQTRLYRSRTWHRPLRHARVLVVSHQPDLRETNDGTVQRRHVLGIFRIHVGVVAEEQLHDTVLHVLAGVVKRRALEARRRTRTGTALEEDSHNRLGLVCRDDGQTHGILPPFMENRVRLHIGTSGHGDANRSAEPFRRGTVQYAVLERAHPLLVGLFARWCHTEDRVLRLDPVLEEKPNRALCHLPQQFGQVGAVGWLDVRLGVLEGVHEKGVVVDCLREMQKMLHHRRPYRRLVSLQIRHDQPEVLHTRMRHDRKQTLVMLLFQQLLPVNHGASGSEEVGRSGMQHFDYGPQRQQSSPVSGPNTYLCSPSDAPRGSFRYTRG